MSIVEQALLECHPSSDVFDAADFNSCALINKLFPSGSSSFFSHLENNEHGAEQSAGIEQTAEKLSVKIKSLDHAILKAIEFQSKNGEKVRREIGVAKQEILVPLLSHIFCSLSSEEYERRNPHDEISSRGDWWDGG